MRDHQADTDYAPLYIFPLGSNLAGHEFDFLSLHITESKEIQEVCFHSSIHLHGSALNAFIKRNKFTKAYY